mgnify:FL=1
MHEVAARAKVSIKTVSNVVNDYPHIRPATRERVEKAIRELGYQVNVSARNLRRGRTGVIGLALPELSVPYFAELADAVMAAADARGVSVLIEMTGAQRERELATLRSPRRSLTDGLLFSPAAISQDDVAALAVDFPAVLLGERIFDGGVDHVTMANVEGARAATHHLLARGARRIAVIGREGRDGQTDSASLRIAGYRQALAEAGVPFDPELILDAPMWHRSQGSAAIARALDAGVTFDAVFGLNDALALGAMHMLHQRRIAVPGEVAVIGFDDVEDAAFATPTLSSVTPGRDEIATTALDFLLERIELGAAAGPPRQVLAQFSVAERESTAR